jgi:2'-5' RNA ligase
VTGAVNADKARLFFALWPLPEIQSALGDVAERLRRECGGRAVPARSIHLTLVFLGDMRRERVATLQALAAKVAAAPFALTFDHAAYWRHNRIVWAGARKCPAALGRLVEQIEQRVSAEGFHCDKRPYVPHITLLRNARRAPADRSSCLIDWPVTRFALMESAPREGGRDYQVIGEWPLAA